MNNAANGTELAKPNGHANGAKKPKEPDPPHVTAVKESLKNHLLAILEKPISFRMLTALETTARISRDLLITMKDPRQLRRRGGVAMGGGVVMGGNYNVPMASYDDEEMGEDSLGYDDGAGGLIPNGIAVGGMRAETFAATLMRELVAMGDKWRQPAPVVETASDLVMSISRARAEKMPDDIIEGLEAKLRERLALEKAEHTISKPAMPTPGRRDDGEARLSSGSTVSLAVPIPPDTEEHDHEHG